MLVVEEVVQRFWCRSQVRARAQFLGEDRSPGTFRSLQFLVHSIGSVHLNEVILHIVDGEPVYLVLRGRHWRVGDAIQQDIMIYRYEP